MKIACSECDGDRRNCVHGMRATLRLVGRETDAALAVVEAARALLERYSGEGEERLGAAIDRYDAAVAARKAEP